MSAIGDINAAFKQLIADQLQGEALYSIVGKVSNIDETARTCDVTPISEDADVLEVRLQASLESDQGVVSIPKDDSFVIVTFINKNTGFVSLCTEVDKVIINTPEMNFDGVDGDSVTIEINGGQNGGLINISPLVDKINAVEELLNSLIGKYNAHTHQTTATISASPAPGVISPTTSTETGTIAPTTTVDDLEDGNITH